MKNIKQSIAKIIVSLFIVITTIVPVHAAGVSASVSKSTVTPGETFTVSFGGGSNTIGRYNISVTNGTIMGESSVWHEQSGNSSVSIKAGSAGTTTVTVTANNVTDVNENMITGSKTLSVTVKTPEPVTPPTPPTPPSTPEPEPEEPDTTTPTRPTTPTTPSTPEPEPEPEVEKSSDNSLSSLTIEGVDLMPKFDKTKTKYTASVMDKKSIEIKASTSDKEAKVTGTGKKDLKLGENKFEIVVTAEDGSTKTYNVTIIMDQKPTVFTEYNGTKLGVVKNTSVLTVPEGFTESTVIIDGKEVISWENKTTKNTIVYLVDNKGDSSFYLYKDGEVVSTYREVMVLGRLLIILDIHKEDQNRTGMKYQEVEIDGTKINGWTFDASEFKGYSLIQVMNQEGKMVDYLYDSHENTMIVYPQVEQSEATMPMTYFYVVCGIAGTMTVVALGAIISALKYKKANKEIIDIVSNK